MPGSLLSTYVLRTATGTKLSNYVLRTATGEYLSDYVLRTASGGFLNPYILRTARETYLSTYTVVVDWRGSISSPYILRTANNKAGSYVSGYILRTADRRPATPYTPPPTPGPMGPNPRQTIDPPKCYIISHSGMSAYDVIEWNYSEDFETDQRRPNGSLKIVGQVTPVPNSSVIITTTATASWGDGAVGVYGPIGISAAKYSRDASGWITELSLLETTIDAARTLELKDLTGKVKLPELVDWEVGKRDQAPYQSAVEARIQALEDQKNRGRKLTCAQKRAFKRDGRNQEVNSLVFEALGYLPVPWAVVSPVPFKRGTIFADDLPTLAVDSDVPWSEWTIQMRNPYPTDSGIDTGMRTGRIVGTTMTTYDKHPVDFALEVWGQWGFVAESRLGTVYIGYPQDIEKAVLIADDKNPNFQGTIPDGYITYTEEIINAGVSVSDGPVTEIKGRFDIPSEVTIRGAEYEFYEPPIPPDLVTSGYTGNKDGTFVNLTQIYDQNNRLITEIKTSRTVEGNLLRSVEEVENGLVPVDPPMFLSETWFDSINKFGTLYKIEIIQDRWVVGKRSKIATYQYGDPVQAPFHPLAETECLSVTSGYNSTTDAVEVEEILIERSFWHGLEGYLEKKIGSVKKLATVIEQIVERSPVPADPSQRYEIKRTPIYTTSTNLETHERIASNYWIHTVRRGGQIFQRKIDEFYEAAGDTHVTDRTTTVEQSVDTNPPPLAPVISQEDECPPEPAQSYPWRQRIEKTFYTGGLGDPEIIDAPYLDILTINALDPTYLKLKIIKKLTPVGPRKRRTATYGIPVDGAFKSISATGNAGQIEISISAEEPLAFV